MSDNPNNKADIAKVIRERLGVLLLENRWSVTELAERISVPSQTAHRWLHPENESPPNIQNLRTIAQTFKISVDWLIGLTSVRESRDHPLRLLETHTSAKQYNAMKAALFASLQSELWLIFRTGKLTHDDAEKRLLENVLQKDSFNKVRLLICDPEDPGTMDQVRSRRERDIAYYGVVVQHIFETLSALFNRFETSGFIDFDKPETLEKFELYYSLYMPAVLAYVADPFSRTGQMVVIEATYKSRFQDGLSFHLRRNEPSQEALFQYYLDDFTRMFDGNYHLPTRESVDESDDIPIVRRIDLVAARQEIRRRLIK